MEQSVKLNQVQVGMIWYEDDTFSFDKLPNKKIKAIIEDIKDGVIYGDLTASDIHVNYEQFVDWDGAKKYIENFSYPCKQNEEIVWYNIQQLREIKKHYSQVRESFKLIGKRYRQFSYWASEIWPSFYADTINFISGFVKSLRKSQRAFIRPVLSLKIK